MPQVILPVLNEARALPWILERMPAGFDPIIVDNGSTDNSAAVALKLGAMVVRQPVPGFGATCYAGLRQATHDVVCFMDADASLDPTELPAVVSPLVSGAPGLVLGRRVPDKGAWPRHARVANRALVGAVHRRTGVTLRDIGPMRAAPREALIALGVEDRRCGWPLEMVMRAIHAGWSIREVPVRYRARVGRSKITSTVRGTALAVQDMARVLR